MSESGQLQTGLRLCRDRLLLLRQRPIHPNAQAGSFVHLRKSGFLTITQVINYVLRVIAHAIKQA